MLSLAGVSRANEPFRYPEARHGKGELRYINGVPVLMLAGSPEEIGTQMGVLALKPAVGAAALFEGFLKEHGLAKFRSLLAKVGETLLARFPEEYRRELDAAAKAGEIERDMLVIGNTFHDVKRLTGCSAFLVEPERSTTGAPLVGRNLDYTLLKGMHQYSLVIVYRPTGKKPFAVVAYPGALVLGCAMSAMNSDGLVFGQNDVRGTADGAPSVDLTKVPTAVLARQVLEQCATKADAEKLLQANKPAGRSIFLLCDKKGAEVCEATSKTIAFRGASQGLCLATNHFCTKGMAIPYVCSRALALQEASSLAKFSVADLGKTMHLAHQKARTAHTIVFEPARLRMHVAFGDGLEPASAFPLKQLDLTELLK
jgi:hypothetical protein